jgi:uncharacterized surface protein with fasciclin (FAS1) repeats
MPITGSLFNFLKLNTMKNKCGIFLSIIILVLSTLSCQESFVYEPSPTQPDGKLNVNIIEYLQSRPDVFSLLVHAIERAGLTNTLRGGTYTLFAPDDIAFKAYLGAKTVNDIPVSDLRKLLEYHLLGSKVLSSDLTLETISYPTLLENKSLLLRRNANFVVNVNGNRVFLSNLEPTNGAVHVIPRVLTP